MPNIVELKRRRNEIVELVRKALDDEKTGRLTTKQFVGTMNPLLEEADEIDGQIKAYNNSLRFTGGLPGEDGTPPPGAGAGSALNAAATPSFRGKAAQFAPLSFGEDKPKAMHQAIQSRTNFAVKTKDFNTVDPLLPPGLQPSVVGPQYETRLLERLPILPTTARLSSTSGICPPPGHRPSWQRVR